MADPLNPNMPHAALAIPPSLARAWSKRWQQWEPHVRYRLNGNYTTMAYEYRRNLHRQRLQTLHAAGCAMYTIRHWRLDDPFVSQEEFVAQLQGAVERQTIRRQRAHRR